MRGFDNLNDRWVAVQVRAGWEIKAARGLRQRGYEELVPSSQQRRRWSDRIKTMEVPLFTGYVFLRFRTDKEQPVITTPGVIRFVGVSNTPIAIDDCEMEALQIASKATYRCGPWPFLQVGQEVEVRNGPLYGLKGKIIRFKNKQRIIITVNLLQQSAFVEIEDHEIAPTGRPSEVLTTASALRHIPSS